jgi:hypothetical protein
VLTNDEEEQQWVNPFIQRNQEKMEQYLGTIVFDSKSKAGQEPFSDLFKNEGSPVGPGLIEKRNLLLLHRLLYDHGLFILSNLADQAPKG